MKNFILNNIFFKILVFVILILGMLIFIFSNHIFNDYAFPWDFLETYYAFPYYWIELARHGIDNSWIPFQGMGYPLYMNLQSGYYYPINWIFVFLDIPYTLHNAVILNILHIFIASVGMLFVARALNMSWTQSYLAAILYLMYGSFYGNSGHIDIIRAYAITPWIITPFIANWNLNSKLFLTSILILPIGIYFFWTGGYIGVVLATFFILCIVLFFRIFILKHNKIVAIYLLGCLIIGFIISSVFILPTILETSQFIRSTAKLNYDYMKLIDFFALIYPVNNNSFGHDITMRSISIGIVGLTFFFIALSKFYKTNFIMVVALLLAIFMITGTLHKYIILYLPQLGLSRFTFSDYKGLIGIFIILIAVDSIRYLKDTNLLYIFFLMICFILFGNYYLNLSNSTQFDLLSLLSILLFTTISIYVFKYNKVVGMVLLLIISLFDFLRIHKNANYWNVENSTNYIESIHKVSLENNNNLINVIKNKDRINRVDENAHPFKYSGYFTGAYMMNDYGGSMHLKSYDKIRKTPDLKSFALLEWTPISGNIVSIKNTDIENKVNFVHLESYNTSEIVYSISSNEDKSFIENEIYWKGWKAKLVDSSGNILQELLPENVDGFRKWNLPSGNYTMIAKFIPPYKELSTYLTLFGILIWLIFIYYIGRKYDYFKITRI